MRVAAVLSTAVAGEYADTQPTRGGLSGLLVGRAQDLRQRSVLGVLLVLVLVLPLIQTCRALAVWYDKSGRVVLCERCTAKKSGVQKHKPRAVSGTPARTSSSHSCLRV